MNIIVNGKKAVLKAGSSFEYIRENPLFTEAEDYSLEIEFPLKDQPENIMIFGALHVQGVELGNITFPCEIDTGTFRKVGILTVTAISETEIKGQFLEGVSQQNFASSIPNTYITDLDFSDYDGSADTQASYNRVMGAGWANLFVWDKTWDSPIFNTTEWVQSGTWIKRHVYLYKLLELVCLKCNLSLDDTELRNVPLYTKVVVVNTMMPIFKDKVYGGFTPLARILPRWTVKELFNEICKFFGCVYEIDSVLSKVTFKACSSVMSTANQISITPLDEFSVEMGSEDASYRGNMKYKIPDGADPDKVNMCPWLIGKSYLYNLFNMTAANFAGYVKAAAWSQSAAVERLNQARSLYYITDKGKYAIITDKKGIQASGAADDDPPETLFCKYEILNQFGDYREGEELGIAPCPLSLRRRLEYPADFPSTSSNGYAYKFAELEVIRDKYVEWYNDDDRIPVDEVLEVVKAGEEKEARYYDKLWCVLISESESPRGYHINTRKLEADGTDDIGVVGDLGLEANYSGKLHTFSYTLSPDDSSIKSNAALPEVDESMVYRFKFLGATIPSPTSIFVIKGQKFACIRITAHFTPEGMSELLEGEFCKIIG